MKRAWIQPTGDELLASVIEDTDSPMVCGVLEKMGIQGVIAPPVPDDEGALEQAVRRACREGCILTILIGGSGGGHRHDPSLGRDFTHCVLERILSRTHSTSLYGKNGHLWSRMVCGYLENMLVVNIPGPFREARAAMEAMEACGVHAPPERLNQLMAQAVCQTYHSGEVLDEEAQRRPHAAADCVSPGEGRQPF